MLALAPVECKPLSRRRRGDEQAAAARARHDGRVRRTLLALPLLLLLLLAGPAAAHTALRSASPAAGSTVDAVTQVVLEFTDTVQPGFSTVAVTGADGVDRSQGDPVLQDGTRVLQEL